MSAARTSDLLADKLVIVPVRTDPKPVHPILHRNAERTVIKPNPRTMKAPVPDSLEVKRRVRRLSFEQCVVLARRSLNFRRQCVKASPEPRGRGVLQSSWAWPDLKSASASDASWSSLPD
jgi:hypothetical protein